MQISGSYKPIRDSLGFLITLFVLFLSIVWIGLVSLTVVAPFMRSRPARRREGGRTGRVLVIVPCKGRDINLRGNLEALRFQDYRNFELVAVVDSERDDAVGAINEAGVRYIVSSRKYGRCSGKVAALITAMKRFPNHDIYVNIDSDVLCRADHVRKLVAPLADSSVGVSTSYPYFRPIGGFWSSVKMVWGFVGNGMMESDLTKFVWGGSMAFRRGLVGAAEMKLLERSLSDDMAIAHFARERGLSINYVNSSSSQVMVKESFNSFWEWANRQTALSILGERKVLYYGLLFYGAQLLLLMSGIALAVLFTPAYAILLLPFAVSVYKNSARANTKRAAAVPVSMAINFIFFANLVIASQMDHIEWRGRRYKLANPF